MPHLRRPLAAAAACALLLLWSLAPPNSPAQETGPLKTATEAAGLSDAWQAYLMETMDEVFEVLAAIEADSEMSPAEKRQEAVAYLRGLRYGPEDKDAFWINDTDGVILMDPYLTHLEGQNLIDFVDAGGIRVFAEFVRLATTHGRGWLEHLWPRYEGGEAVTKISLVRLFAPWNWIVGTGVYREEYAAFEDPQDAIQPLPLEPEPDLRDNEAASPI